MKTIAILIFSILLFAPQAGAEEPTIFDSEYIKYPREIYEKYCGHHLTAGGHWDCFDALDRSGIPFMDCIEPSYVWAKEKEVAKKLGYGWKQAPLNFVEKVINPPYAPKVYWFYKCPE